MATIIRDKETNPSFRCLPRDLSKQILGEVRANLHERADAIIQFVENEQDRQPDEGTDCETRSHDNLHPGRVEMGAEAFSSMEIVLRSTRLVTSTPWETRPQPVILSFRALLF